MASEFKLPPPKNFSGKQEDWDDFSYRFKAYMVMRNHKFERFFNVAETATAELTSENFRGEGGVVDEEGIKLSHELHYMLIHVCEGSAASLIRQSDSRHGVETWRKLHAHFSMRATVTSMGRLASILDVDFKHNDFVNDFLKWEEEIQKFEKETTSVVARFGEDCSSDEPNFRRHPETCAT